MRWLLRGLVCGFFLLWSCGSTRPHIRLLSDNPWLWSAVSLYNQEHARRTLVVFDYQPRLEPWLSHPEYRKADVVVTASPPDAFQPRLSLKAQGADLTDHTYPGVEALMEGRDALLPLLLSPPLYLISTAPPWNELQFLTPDALSGVSADLLAAKVPQLAQEMQALAGQPPPPRNVNREDPQPWYLRMRQWDEQVPFMPLSLTDLQEFVSYQPDPAYQVINLADEQGRWLPRRVSWLMVNGKQGWAAKRASLHFVEWLMLKENQRRIALQNDVPGFMGAFSLYPAVNLEWIAQKLPALSGRVFVNGILS